MLSLTTRFRQLLTMWKGVLCLTPGRSRAGWMHTSVKVILSAVHSATVSPALWIVLLFGTLLGLSAHTERSTFAASVKARRVGAIEMHSVKGLSGLQNQNQERISIISVKDGAEWRCTIAPLPIPAHQDVACNCVDEDNSQDDTDQEPSNLDVVKGAHFYVFHVTTEYLPSLVQSMLWREDVRLTGTRAGPATRVRAFPAPLFSFEGVSRFFQTRTVNPSPYQAMHSPSGEAWLFCFPFLIVAPPIR